MPELPEVETVKRGLIDIVLNKKITSVDVYYDRIIQNVSTTEFKEKLQGQTFKEIKRRGKFLIFIFEDVILLSHLRMEGKYYLRLDEEKSKHEHIIFHLENGETLRYQDTRKFGVMYLCKTTDLSSVLREKPLSNLGYEPGEKELTEEYLKNKFSKMSKPIKSALLDQTIILGLGNIYADEVCFMAKINPEEKAKDLTNDEILNIIKYSDEVIQKAIRLGGTTIRSFTSSHEISGRFQNELLVHTKEICPACSAKIEKIYVGGRGTYFCPTCQKKHRS